MKALVVYAHPDPQSYCAALHDVVLEELNGKGWKIDDCDLNAEGFSPVLTTDERRNYHNEAINTLPVQSYVDRLRQADALVLVFPVWNFGYPAILKGFFDRVFLPGVSFNLVDGKVKANLLNIKALAAVTTYGGNRLRAFMAGDPPRKSITRSVRYVMSPAVRMKYLALYDMNRANDRKRAAFLARVRHEMKSFA